MRKYENIEPFYYINCTNGVFKNSFILLLNWAEIQALYHNPWEVNQREAAPLEGRHCSGSMPYLRDWRKGFPLRARKVPLLPDRVSFLLSRQAQPPSLQLSGELPVGEEWLSPLRLHTAVLFIGYQTFLMNQKPSKGQTMVLSKQNKGMMCEGEGACGFVMELDCLMK